MHDCIIKIITSHNPHSLSLHLKECKQFALLHAYEIIRRLSLMLIKCTHRAPDRRHAAQISPDSCKEKNRIWLTQPVFRLKMSSYECDCKCHAALCFRFGHAAIFLPKQSQEIYVVPTNQATEMNCTASETNQYQCKRVYWWLLITGSFLCLTGRLIVCEGPLDHIYTIMNLNCEIRERWAVDFFHQYGSQRFTKYTESCIQRTPQNIITSHHFPADVSDRCRLLFLPPCPSVGYLILYFVPLLLPGSTSLVRLFTALVFCTNCRQQCSLKRPQR